MNRRERRAAARAAHARPAMPPDELRDALRGLEAQSTRCAPCLVCGGPGLFRHPHGGAQRLCVSCAWSHYHPKACALCGAPPVTVVVLLTEYGTGLAGACAACDADGSEERWGAVVERYAPARCNAPGGAA